MTYELAKQLKDAGYEFVKIDPSREIITGKKQVYTGFAFEGKEFYEPTLSELIEACGKQFFGLYCGANHWIAEEFVTGIQPRHTQGKTPEEAVAKLWMELNKKT